MTRTDLRVMCTALGFMAVALKGEKLPKADMALRANAFARLIKQFCLTSVPEAITEKDANAASISDNTVERMADAIVEIIKDIGDCLPQDLQDKGFTPTQSNIDAIEPGELAADLHEVGRDRR
jgi:hypothetical protein